MATDVLNAFHSLMRFANISPHAFQDHTLLSHVLECLKSMREANDSCDIDAENFYRLVLIVRAIAVSRPHNLAKFAEQYANKSIDESNGTCYDH